MEYRKLENGDLFDPECFECGANIFTDPDEPADKVEPWSSVECGVCGEPNFVYKRRDKVWALGKN